MKKQMFIKTVTLCAFFVTTVESARAQTWPMPQAEWRYCITNDLGMPAGYIDFAYTRDTLIDETIYNVIQPVGGSDNNFHPVYTASMALFTRFSNDTVYRYVLGNEFLYFTFNSQPGDAHLTFRSPGASNDWNTTACSPDLVLETLETSSQKYGGQTLQQWIIEDTLIQHLYEWGLSDAVTYTLVERIGIIDAYPFIFTQEPPADPGAPCSLPTCSFKVTLGKYTDLDFSHEFGECFGVGIDEKDIFKTSFSVFPNPVYDLLYIDVPSYGNTTPLLIITDLLGNIVLEKEISKNLNAISVKDLPKGIYFVFLHKSDGLPEKLKVIKM
jgi:hypothetical protein